MVEVTDVLIVDDDPDIRAILSFTLEDAGYHVREAADGAQAVVAIQKHAPDCLVLDVMMPGVDGFGVLRSRRRLALAPKMRVLMLTAKTAEKDFARGWELGADEYITKPFDPEDLLDAVRALLDKGQKELHLRRETELKKAELLDRLESAFNRPPMAPH
ncbi:MAG TPA: response regulator [Acidimicrobiales bacterium]|nr:response regulator [Acidimicrobiales bacterium]